MNRYAILLVLAPFIITIVNARITVNDFIKLPSEKPHCDDSIGTRWAVLLAGSNGYWNYRHQVNTIPIVLHNFTEQLVDTYAV